MIFIVERNLVGISIVMLVIFCHYLVIHNDAPQAITLYAITDVIQTTGSTY